MLPVVNSPLLLGASLLSRWAERAHGRRTTGVSQMRTRAAEKTLPYEGLTEQKLNVLFSPISCGQCLQEH
jgi:hypothetical protein